MFRKAEREGYVLIDHSDSPGFACDEAIAGGRGSLFPFVGPGQKFEGATYTCSHCERVVVKNPDRLRQRGYCVNCDHDICDGCAVALTQTGVCYPFKQRAEEFLERISKGA